MKDFELKIQAEKLSDVTDALEAYGLKPSSVVDTEAIKKLGTTKPKGSCCGQGGKQSPSMLKKLKNYRATTKRWHKAGKPLASKKVVIERLSICITCDSLIKDWECSECGCPMMEKAKMGIDKLCELNNW